jgi:hypothetical protein
MSRESNRSPGWAAALRTLAAVMTVALAFAAVAPPFASAEVETEGEGSVPPGSVTPGLEEGPAFEPGGEETALGEVPASAGEEEPPQPVEGAPMPEAEEPAPPVATEVAPSVGPPPPVTEAPPAAVGAGPVYGAEGAGPDYEAAPARPAPGEPVRNEAIVAPAPSPTPDEKAETPAPSGPKATPETEEAPAPGPAEIPEPAVSSPAPAPAGVDRAGSLGQRRFHTVAPGECLWSIAEGVLPAGAGNAEIAAEVARLWRLNAARIGTGDPSLILVGTVLRLH